MPQPRKSYSLILLLMIGALLIIFASRVMRLPGLNMGKDEVWSVWITLDSLRNTIAWTPYDWPPASYIMIWIWRNLTGINPFTLRLLTAFFMLIAAALAYRAALLVVPGSRAAKRNAGLFTALCLSGFGYVLYISTQNRAYLPMLTLFLAGFVQAIYYHRRPTTRRAIVLALTFILGFYFHLTVALGVLMIGLYTVIVYRRPLLWVLPGVVTVFFCLPELISKVGVFGIKQEISDKFIPYVPPLDRIANHYLDYAGSQPALWGAIFVIAGAFLIDSLVRHRERIGGAFQGLITLRAAARVAPDGIVARRVAALLLWLIMPVLIFPFTRNIDAFQARHLAWVMVGFALFAAWGLALLPRPGRLAVGVVLVGLLFAPIPLDERYETVPRLPLVTAFDQLRDRVRSGDAVLFDLICSPGCVPIDAEEWDYFTRTYFPDGGIEYITPAQARTERYPRVWYVHFAGHGEPEIIQAASTDRATGQAFTVSFFEFQLYERAPDNTGVPFVNGVRFHGAELLNDGGNTLVFHEGDPLHIRLWWSTDTALTTDYSVGFYIVKADDPTSSVLAQSDSAPQIVTGETATSRWLPATRYLETRTLTLPYPAGTGNYRVYMTLYQWWDNARITAPGMTPDNLLLIGTIIYQVVVTIYSAHDSGIVDLCGRGKPSPLYNARYS